MVVQKVNLLDRETEPTDEQLSNLMKTVALCAGEKNKSANESLRASLAQEAESVYQRFLNPNRQNLTA
jgi:hypothetical protein